MRCAAADAGHGASACQLLAVEHVLARGDDQLDARQQRQLGWTASTGSAALRPMPLAMWRISMSAIDYAWQPHGHALNAPQTVGGLLLGDRLGTQTLTFAGANALTFDASRFEPGLHQQIQLDDGCMAGPAGAQRSSGCQHLSNFDINGVSDAQVAITSTASDLVKNGAGTLRLNMNATAFGGNWVLNQGTLTSAASARPHPAGHGCREHHSQRHRQHRPLYLTLETMGPQATVTSPSAAPTIIFQGAATINVNQNSVAGANTGNTIILDNLTMNGGILVVTGSNSYALRFNGTTHTERTDQRVQPNQRYLDLGRRDHGWSQHPGLDQGRHRPLGHHQGQVPMPTTE